VDSHELIGRSGGNRWIPLVAVVQDDFRQIIRHWAFLIWAGLAVVLPILWMMNASQLTAATIAGLLKHVGTHEVAKPRNDGARNGDVSLEWNNPPRNVSGEHVVQKPQENYIPYAQDARARQRSYEIADRPYQEPSDGNSSTGRYTGIYDKPQPGLASQLGGKLLSMHLLVWIALAVILGASAISSEFASIGESVLCWGVARWQYFLGKLAARCAAAMTLVVVLTLPMLFVFNARAGADLAWWPAVCTTLNCAAVVGCVVALAVSLGVWCRTSMRAVGVSLISLMFVGLICTFLAPPAYSPLDLAQSFQASLRGVELAYPNYVLNFFAYTAGAVSVLSFGKFMWADL
jgi:hypothetical protein